MADHENRQPQLVGSYEHGLDGKGRMVLPAKIRARIGETGMIGMLDGCLGLWSLDRFDDVADRILAKAESGEARSEEHTSELQSLMRITYAVFCLKKKHKITATQSEM